MLKRLLLFFTLGLGALCLDLLFVLVFVNATEVNCARQRDETYTCQLRTLLLGRVPAWERVVEEVVDIELVDDGCVDGCSYRAEFITATGAQVPLSEVYTDREVVVEQVNTLGSQMQRGVDPIAYRSDPPWWALYLIGGLTVMSLVIVLISFRPRL